MFFKTNTSPTFAQRYADLDKDDIELAEQEEALLAEDGKLTLPNGRASVSHGPVPRRLEIAKEVPEIRVKRASIREQRAEIRKEEERHLRATLQDTVDAELKNNLAPAAVQMFTSLKAIEKIKDSLTDRGFGFYPNPISIDMDVFDVSRGGDFAKFLRDLATRGMCKLPKEIA